MGALPSRQGLHSAASCLYLYVEQICNFFVMFHLTASMSVDTSSTQRNCVGPISTHTVFFQAGRMSDSIMVWGFFVLFSSGRLPVELCQKYAHMSSHALIVNCWLIKGVWNVSWTYFDSFSLQMSHSSVGQLAFSIHEKLLAKQLSLYNLTLVLLASSGSLVSDWVESAFLWTLCTMTNLSILWQLLFLTAVHLEKNAGGRVALLWQTWILHCICSLFN